MNESDREEPMKEEVSNENGEYADALDKFTYLLLSLNFKWNLYVLQEESK